MKKLLALSFLLPCFFLSCKKSSSGSGSSGSYHLTATVDGSAKTFNVTTTAVMATSGAYTELSISGIASTITGELMNVAISNAPGGKPIVAGTYTDATPGFTITAFYQLNTTTQYIGGTSIDQTAVAIGAPIVNHLKIVLTSIDASTVKGTFSGDLFFNDDPSAAKKTVTSGDFYMKLF